MTAAPPSLWPRISARRWLPLFVALALLGTGWSRLSFVFHPNDVMPREIPGLLPLLEALAEFEYDRALAVGLEESGAGLSTEGLQALARITARLERMGGQGVERVRSLANLPGIPAPDETGHVEGEFGEPVMPEVPTTVAGLQALAARIRGDALISGALVSPDLRGYLVLVTPSTTATPSAVARAVRDVVEAERGPLSAVYLGQGPVELEAEEKVVARGLYVLAALMVLSVAMLWAFRRGFRGFGAPLLWTGLGLFAWLGALGLIVGELRVPHLLPGVFVLFAPWVLFAVPVGAPKPHSAEDPARPIPPDLAAPTDRGRQAARMSMVVAAFGILLAGMAVPSEGVRTMVGWGLVCAAVAPVLIAWSFWGEGRGDASGPLVALRLPSSVVPVSAWLRWAPVGGLVALLGLTLWATGAGRGQPPSFRIDPGQLFGDDSSYGRAQAFFARHFGGDRLLFVPYMVDLRVPDEAQSIQLLADALRRVPGVADVRDAPSIVAALGGAFTGVVRVPPEAKRLQGLWAFLEGHADLRALVNDDRTRGILVLRLASQSPAVETTLITTVARLTGEWRAGTAVERAFALLNPESTESRRATFLGEWVGVALGPRAVDAWAAALADTLTDPAACPAELLPKDIDVLQGAFARDFAAGLPGIGDAPPWNRTHWREAVGVWLSPRLRMLPALIRDGFNDEASIQGMVEAFVERGLAAANREASTQAKEAATRAGLRLSDALAHAIVAPAEAAPSVESTGSGRLGERLASPAQHLLNSGMALLGFPIVEALSGPILTVITALFALVGGILVALVLWLVGWGTPAVALAVGLGPLAAIVALLLSDLRLELLTLCLPFAWGALASATAPMPGGAAREVASGDEGGIPGGTRDSGSPRLWLLMTLGVLPLVFLGLGLAPTTRLALANFLCAAICLGMVALSGAMRRLSPVPIHPPLP